MPKVQDILVFFQTSPGLDITPFRVVAVRSVQGHGDQEPCRGNGTPIQTCVSGDARRMAGHPDERDETSQRRRRIRTWTAAVSDGVVPVQ